MPKIVVIGSINIDLVVRTPRFALAGETILGRDFQTLPGGKGANQAVASARMGAEVAMIGRVGSDEFGATLRQKLALDGINIEHLAVTEGESTGVALITVEDQGENTIIIVPGANGHLSIEDIDAARGLIAGADMLMMQLEIPLPTVEYAAQVAQESGVTVMLNAAPALPLPGRLFSLVDYLIVNETELLQLAGTGGVSTEESAKVLLFMGVRNVVVTLGAQGSILIPASGASISAPAFPVHVIDTTAAGDGFVGTLAVALTEGVPAHEALRWGNAAGALVVTIEGAQPSLPSHADVAEFLKKRHEESQLGRNPLL